MIYEYASMAEFDEACKTHPEFNHVVSPGGAIGGRFKSRTAVYQAVKRGKLDMVRIKERFGHLILLIPVSSLENYEKTAKVGRPPLSSLVRHSSDRISGYWPDP